MKSVKKLKLEELNRVDVETFKQTEKIPISIIVDNFRSALNVGSIFRTSDAFLISKIYLCGISATPPNKEILKTAIGANHAVDWIYVETTTEAIHKAKNEGAHVVGIEQTNASISLADFHVNVNESYAIVMGNEVEGISTDSLDVIDTFIEIPQYGTKHSLNVSVCAGIVIYEFAKHYLR
ncbi:TrmH family RNA methyltransferase [Portibacter lacus]|uniref:tRNA/rRNA methyltransferase n=1 Tax=Portibacter lacus TaxID=1099794 RepID=A0AA37WDS5_9BACT|nr:TrmH family RNA methyltransferase [Portibacter lacus]GLR16302.1 tRNA/rRNA methyltransferase [Portibacter lacus]